MTNSTKNLLIVAVLATLACLLSSCSHHQRARIEIVHTNAPIPVCVWNGDCYASN